MARTFTIKLTGPVADYGGGTMGRTIMNDDELAVAIASRVLGYEHDGEVRVTFRDDGLVEVTR